MKHFLLLVAVLFTACAVETSPLVETPPLAEPGAPAAPTNLTAATNKTAVALAWKAVTGATEYRVYRLEQAFGPRAPQLRPSKRFAAQAAVEPAALPKVFTTTRAASFKDTKVEAGHTYYYRVTARDAATGLESAPSNQASAKVADPAPTHAPAPTANPISILVGATGHTTVDPVDPDAGDTHTFTVHAAPAHGHATVDATGRVAYTPDAGFWGQDELAVRVEDQTGLAAAVTVPVRVGQAPFDQSAYVIPDALKNDGHTRLVITHVEPDPALLYTENAPLTITATVQYSLPTTTTITFARTYTYWVAPTAITTVTAPMGSGVTTFTFTFTPTKPQFVLSMLPSFEQGIAFTAVSGRPTAKVVSTNVPTGAVLSGLGYEIEATLELAFGSLGAFNHAWFAVSDGLEPGNAWYTWLMPRFTEVTQVPLRLNGMFACGQTSLVFQFDMENASYVGVGFANFPVIPPRVSVSAPLTGVPLVNQDSHLAINAESCAGSTTVNVTSTAGWFTPDVTQATLPASLGVTFHGGALPIGPTGEAFLVLTPVDGSFAPVRIPVSAVRHDFDPALYTALGLNGEDDFNVAFALPFTFPIAGTGYTQTYVNTNGHISFGWNYNDKAAWMGPLDLVPATFGPLYVANGGDMHSYEPGSPAADVYHREVTDVTGHYVELVWWNQGTWELPARHYVYRTRLYDDGRFMTVYDQMKFFGTETIGFYEADGSMPVEIEPFDVVLGQPYWWGPY